MSQFIVYIKADPTYCERYPASNVGGRGGGICKKGSLNKSVRV